MSLMIWLPFDGNINNYGLANWKPTKDTVAATWDNGSPQKADFSDFRMYSTLLTDDDVKKLYSLGNIA